MSSVASNAACPIFDIRLQRQSVLQVIDQELQLRVHDVQSVLQVVNMNLPDSEVFLPIRWTQIEMVSIGVRNNASCFDLLFASSDHGHFDFLQVSVPINPAAAGLVQTIHEHVEVTQIPQALVLLPLRKLHSKFSFRQVYWWYQVTSNTLEIMFALTFFLTLQRRFNSSAEGILSSLGKLQNDFLTILNGELLLPDWPVLEVLYKTLQAYFGSFLLPAGGFAASSADGAFEFSRRSTDTDHAVAACVSALALRYRPRICNSKDLLHHIENRQYGQGRVKGKSWQR